MNLQDVYFDSISVNLEWGTVNEDCQVRPCKMHIIPFSILF